MNVPQLRFKEFGGEWEVKSLGDISNQISYGLTVRPTYVSNGIPLISAREISKGVIDYENAPKISQESFDNLSNKAIAQKGDIFLSKTGTIGLTAYVSSDITIAVTQNIAVIRVTKKSISHQFVLEFVRTKKFHKSAMDKVNTSTIMDLQLQDIRKLRISLPTLPEQTKIANFLTTIDERINQLNRKKELMTQYKQGVMQQIFSQQLRFKDDNGEDFGDWEEKRLTDLTQIYDGTHMTPNYTESGVPFYSVEHLTNNNFNDTKFISEDVFEKENKRVMLQKGDILMTRIGDIGTAKYIDWDVRASFYVSLSLIKKSNKINSLYLCHYINSSIFQRELHQRTIHVAFPKKINLGEIGNCLVKVPPLQEQTKIANFLTALDEKIQHIAKQIEATKQYKQGLLQQMFV